MKFGILLFSSFFITQAFAYETIIKKGMEKPELEALLVRANSETGLDFKLKDFELIEDRQLATGQYQFYVQMNSGVPISGTAIRIWKESQTQELKLAELHLNEDAKKNEGLLVKKYQKAKFSSSALKSKQLSSAIVKLVEQVVSQHETDTRILGMKFKDFWINSDLVRSVEVRSRRGFHTIQVSLLRNAVIESNYNEFPQSDYTQSFKANVFPMYEEVEGTGEKLPFEVKTIKYIDTTIHETSMKPFGDLENLKLSEASYRPILAETEFGRLNGFWSEASLRRMIEGEIGKLPLVANNLQNGLLLSGKYATINLHPGVIEYKNQLIFPLSTSGQHIVSWKEVNGAYEATPISGFGGKKIISEEELLSRLPERLPDHNPVSYINSGFDEVQVYYAVSVLMEAMAEMGFEDPELSTKPFHAFLFDPDISMKDNAYYYDNTINFTTYTAASPNLARDNPTIWHELGHGVMDRLMGSHLGFADSKGGYGGLSEGMADFLAMLVVEHQTSGASFPGKNDFRIINKTGFYLTNEFHDEGEAYGGAMNDMLLKTIEKLGREGLYDLTDLTLEAMRLTRNHPALSAKSWFEHMLIADELGSEVRESNQFREIILESLVSRNFSFIKEFTPAFMKVNFGGIELTNASPASRERPIQACGQNGEVKVDLSIQLSPGDSNFIKFPAIVKVEYKKGALQGAIKWAGEESNPTVYTVTSKEDLLNIPLSASINCEVVNQPDGSCKDYAYLQVFNLGDQKPLAKKRFYLRLNTPNCREN
jgi:hypothetical protein